MAVVIAGPTASGKSGLALRLADRLGGTVINADAMQVYADLRVLTARPSEMDETAVPHALYGMVDGASAFSVALYAAAARDAVQRGWDAGRLPVIVGGSGMYLAALFAGLAPVPRVPAEVRARWRAAQATEPPEALHAALAERDPAMAANLRPSDPQRIVRALEVIEGTGRSLADWHAEAGPALLDAATTQRMVLAPDRALLREAIADRFEAMVASGAVEEAAALIARGLHADLPVMRAIGVRHLAAAHAGDVTLSEAVTLSVNETRQYAKRQETWFRHRFADWPRAVDPDAAFHAMLPK